MLRSLSLSWKSRIAGPIAVAITLTTPVVVHAANDGVVADSRDGRLLAQGVTQPDLVAQARMLTQQATEFIQHQRYVNAEPLLRQALAWMEVARGPDDREVGTSVKNLAGLYLAQGRYGEAELLLQRALGIFQRTLGPWDPNVAWSLYYLGEIYKSQGRYGDAEPLYLRARAIYEKAFGPDHRNVAHTDCDIADVLQFTGRVDEAESLYQQALAIFKSTLGADHPDTGLCAVHLATLYLGEARYAEAERFFRLDLDATEKTFGSDHPNVARGLGNLAMAYFDQGRYGEAEPLFRRALAINEKAKGTDASIVAHTLSNSGANYEALGRYDVAEAQFRRALRIQEKNFGPGSFEDAVQLTNIARVSMLQARYIEAEALLQRAMPMLNKAGGPDSVGLAMAQAILGSLYKKQGRYNDAEPSLKRALEIEEKIHGPTHLNVAKALFELADLYQAKEQTEAALAVSTRAVDIFERHLARDLAQRSTGRAAEQRTGRDYFEGYIDIAYAASTKAPQRKPYLTAETFRVAQLARSSEAGQAVAEMASRFATDRDNLAMLVRQRQDAARRWQRLDAEDVKAASGVPDDFISKDPRNLRLLLEQAAEQLDALDAQIDSEYPRYAELSNPKPVQLEVAKALLEPDEALLVYLAGKEETWLWVVRPDSAAFYRLEIDAAGLIREVAALRARLDPAQNPDLLPYPATRAYSLFEKILAPVTPRLVGVHRLLIVPDGALQSLPLSVLVTKPPAHDADSWGDNRTIAWLARDYAVTVMPSVSALRALRQGGTAPRGSRLFLGIGDPVLRENRANARIDAVSKLTPLPETAGELREIAQILGDSQSDLLLGEEANEPALRRVALDQYRVIEFATHGLMSGELKGLAEPALVLTPSREASPDNDGLLTASKIATLKLNADWVVLSACNTAASDGTPDAGGLSGLAKAFFYAGARALLVSNWSVPSKTTVKLITGTFGELKENPTIGRAEALRRAEIAMLDPKNPPIDAHPLVWAPFILAGEGGAGR
jgi:CHAT domain-containing protein/TolA-binding protein